jgi:hypothetical protein
MNSNVLDSFWEMYDKLDDRTKSQARKSFNLWQEYPYHRSLNFKCINSNEDIWSVRISHKYRALGILQENAITWFWIGKHDEYEEFFG